MMRLWIVLAALFLAGPVSAENVLMKSNGLGAAAGAMIGATVGAAAFGDKPQWQGYPTGNQDDGIHSPQADDSVSAWLQSGQKSDCVASKPEMAGLATALKDDLPAELPPEGQIRLDQAQVNGVASESHKYNPNAPDSAGPSVSCAAQ